jgi:hypothetical protein
VCAWRARGIDAHPGVSVHQNASRVRVACARKHIEEGQPRINPVKKPPSRKQYAFMSNFFDALLVFNSWGHMQNPAYADQDSPCPRIFDKWNLLGVKKTE